MSITTNVDVVQSALWPQGDIRDPLGVWGARLGVTGDATTDPIQVGITVPAERKAAYLYTCYSVTIVQLAGAIAAGAVAKSRLLTSWPNIDPIAGVQAYGSTVIRTIGGTTSLNAPERSPTDHMLGPFDRFILLFDPRPQGSESITIVELEWSDNVDGGLYSFEAYGYFWDRSILNAPGGPRHPGAS